MRIGVTLGDGAFEGLTAALNPIGVGAVATPLLTFGPPLSWEALDRALSQLTGYQAVALTSPRAARVLADRLPLSPPAPPIWAIGPATAAPLRATGLTVRLPDRPEAGTLGQEILRQGASRVLFLCGEHQRHDLPAALHAAGVRVDEVIVYRALLKTALEIRAAVSGVDALLVGSHRVVAAVATAVVPQLRPALVCLGRSLAATARSQGWPDDRVAIAVTPDSVGCALLQLFPVLLP